MSRLHRLLFGVILAGVGLALWIPGLGWGSSAAGPAGLDTAQHSIYLPFIARQVSTPPDLTLSVSPAIVTPGDEISVTGAGFTPGGTVQLSLIAPSGQRITPAGAAAQPDQSGRLGFQFRLPDSLAWPSGVYTLDAYDLHKGQSVDADFQVSGVVLPLVQSPLQSSPAITVTITPNAGPAGTILTVQGRGFTPGGPIRRWFVTSAGQRFDFLPLSRPADASGQFQETFALPDNLTWPLGAYTYTALDTTTAGFGMTSFTITAPPASTPAISPSLSITPTTGTLQTVFMVQGSGFTPGGPIQQWLVTPAGLRAEFTQWAVADTTGRYAVSFFLSSNVAWPLGAYRYYALEPTTGILASIDFWVTGVGPVPPTATPTPTGTPIASPTPGSQSIRITPASGTVGTVFTVYGADFTSNGPVQRWIISPGGLRFDLAPYYLTADTGGGFTQPFFLGTGFAWPSGTYAFYALDVVAGQTVTTPFTVGAQASPMPTRTPGATVTPGPGPSVSISPPNGTVGTPFRVTGAGFTPFGTVEQWLVSPNGQRLDFNIPFISADGSGGFTMSFFLTGMAPPGTYTTYARDVVTGRIASIPFNITGTSGTPGPTATAPAPGSQPGLNLSPAAGTIGTLFTVVGFSFTPGSTVQHWLIDPAGQRLDFVPSLLRADVFGGYTSSFSFPPGVPWAPGAYVYHAFDMSRGLEATAHLTLTLSSTPQPTLTATPATPPAGLNLTVSPSSGGIGQLFTATATGLTPGGLAQIWLVAPDTSQINFAQPFLVAGNTGQLMFQFSFPLGATFPFGSYRLVIRDVTTNRSAFAQFDRTPGGQPQVTTTPGPNVQPGVAISPTVGTVGTVFDVTGTGFTSSGLLQTWLTGPSGQRYDFSQPTLRADAAGNFALTFYLRGAFSLGRYTYSAHDINATKTVTTTFELVTGPTGQPNGPPRAEQVAAAPGIRAQVESTGPGTPAGIILPGQSPAPEVQRKESETDTLPHAIVIDAGR